MRDIKASLNWITDILKELKIPFHIAGGLAAIAHGSNRELLDIDIDIPENKFDLLKERVNGFIVNGPSHVKDEHWDLLLITLNHYGQVIDISGAYQTKIFNQETQEWCQISTNFLNSELIEIFGLKVPVISREELLAYKKILARTVDLVDIEAIKASHLTQLQQFIEQYNFATLISQENGNMLVSHVPIILYRDLGEYGTLAWHVAKQNPHAKSFDGNENALLIFHGPHSYISPQWYKSYPNVPTWNYAVVRAYGNPQEITNDDLINDLTQMVMQQEKNSNYVIPNDYMLKLMNHIVGFRMQITKIENIFKLGQNRNQEDQEGMILGLLNSDNGLSLADLMKSIQIRNYKQEE